MWGGRWERGSCLGAHVHPWWIHVHVCQNQYSIVKSNKVKIKIKKKTTLGILRKGNFYLVFRASVSVVS